MWPFFLSMVLLFDPLWKNLKMSLRTALIIDDRKLRQDLVMHLDLLALENSTIKRLDYTTLFKNKDLISEMFLSILFSFPMFMPTPFGFGFKNKWYVIESIQFLRRCLRAPCQLIAIPLPLGLPTPIPFQVTISP